MVCRLPTALTTYIAMKIGNLTGRYIPSTCGEDRHMLEASTFAEIRLPISIYFFPEYQSRSLLLSKIMR
jgi:hypothetical protein